MKKIEKIKGNASENDTDLKILISILKLFPLYREFELLPQKIKFTENATKFESSRKLNWKLFNSSN